MEYTLIITGDENDADYKSRESNIEEEDLIIIKKFVELIKKIKIERIGKIIGKIIKIK